MDRISVDHSRVEAERKNARIDLAAAFRQAVIDNFHEGIANHFTLSVPGNDQRFYLNSYGLHWSEVTASNLLEVGFDGRILSGEGLADESAISIHGPIHRLIPTAKCVMHTHMPYCTALTQLEDMTLEITGQTAAFFSDRIAYDYQYNGLADTTSEGERLASVIGSKSILMLANHGVIVTAESVSKAYYQLYYLERACRTQLFSMWTGKARNFINKDVVEQIRAQTRSAPPKLPKHYADYTFAALKRGLDRTQPDYAS